MWFWNALSLIATTDAPSTTSTASMVLAGAALGLVSLALLEMALKQHDRTLLQSLWQQGVASGECRTVRTRAGHRIAIRFTRPATASSLPPIVIPNGLAANVLLTGATHDRLVAAGFSVLSFDRRGVGFSEPRMPNPHGGGADRFFPAQTVDECVDEMLDAMLACIPDGGNDRPPSPCAASSSSAGGGGGGVAKGGGGKAKWIVVGPSMGSIVAQCFLASPDSRDRVAGFLNLDGLPFPFCSVRSTFMGWSKYYAVFSWLAWLGIFRPFFWLFSGKMLASLPTKASKDVLPLDQTILRAQFNQPAMWQSTQAEFTLMLDCAAIANEAWGHLSPLAMSAESFDTLLRTAPRRNGTFTLTNDVADALYGGAGREAASDGVSLVALAVQDSCWTTLPRSKSERGVDWCTAEESEALCRLLASPGPSSSCPSSYATTAMVDPAPPLLAQVFASIPVRVMSARSYDYAAGDQYTPRMRDLSCAEHALHAMVGGCELVMGPVDDGGRSPSCRVLPREDADRKSRRYMFPTKGHNNLFAEVDVAVLCCRELAEMHSRRVSTGTLCLPLRGSNDS